MNRYPLFKHQRHRFVRSATPAMATFRIPPYLELHLLLLLASLSFAIGRHSTTLNAIYHLTTMPKILTVVIATLIEQLYHN